MLNNFYLDIELPKSSQKTVLNITETELEENQDRVLLTLQKECIDLNSWFYIILYYYSKGDYTSFEKFSKELSKIDVEQNPFYKSQKILFINIINIISLFYSFIAYRSKDKESFESYSKLSTSLSNKADDLLSYHSTTIIITAFFAFIQGDYENSERNFSSFSEHGSDKNTNIVILSKLGRALIAYNQGRYEKAIEFFASLVKEYNYINENILESLGICYYKANKVQKAKEIFEATISQYPNNYKVKTYLALIKLSNLNEEENNSFNLAFEELMTAYKMNNFSDNTIPALLVNLCNIFLISGKFEEAGILCQKLNNQLEYGEIKFNSESAFENSAQNNKIIRGYNEIKSAIYVINAKYLLSIGKKKEAYIKFLNSVQENPKNIEAQFGLGRIYFLTNNLADAENCFMECKKILDENKWVSFKILKYYGYVISMTKYKPKDIEKAVELLKQAIDIKKDDIDCYIKLGELLNLREPEKSLKYYMDAVELIRSKRKADKKELKVEKEQKNKNIDEPSIYSDDILPELLNNIGCTLLLKQEYKDVEKYLNEAKSILKEEIKKINHKYKNKDIKDNKDNKDNKNDKENFEETIDKADRKKLLRFNALKISVEFNLALYYDSQAQFDRSHYHYKNIIKENPYFVEAYIKLSELYKKRGNKSKADAYIKLAIEKYYKLVQDDRKTVKKEEDKTNGNPTELNNFENKYTNEIKKQSNDKMEIEKEEEKKEEKEIDKKGEENTSKKEEKAEPKKIHRLIMVMGKPVNPMLIQASYLYESGKEYEAISILNKILMEYKPNDPYTLTFLANIYYSMAIDVRTKSMDKEKMKKAIELYFRALENDKYNALAAIGLSNCLCEFNYVDKAIDIYRSIMEKFPDDHNALVNSSFIYMDDKKYEKAFILLHKVLMSIFHGNNAKIENLLIKCCIEMKEFKTANQHIKNLMIKYPDNLVYQYNYGFLLYSQFEDIINKSTRKYSETEKAIKLISRALKIFESLNKTKKEDRYFKIIQKNEFYYKCEEMLNICKVNLNKAKEISIKDMENEENMKKKNEEDLNEYRKKMEEKEQKEKEEKEKTKDFGEQDERIKEENLEIMEKINRRNLELQMERMKEKEKKGKKRGRKKEREYEDEYDNQDLGLEEKEYEESNIAENEEKENNEANSDYYDEDEEIKKEKPKKKLLLKKRRHSDDEDNDLNNENKENDNINNDENKNEDNNEDINTNENNKEPENNVEENNEEKEENENKPDDNQNENDNDDNQERKNNIIEDE